MSMVEWKKLGDICVVQRGKRLTKDLLDENSAYPVYHGGLEPLGRYGQYNREANTVMVINVGASAGTVGFSDCRFWSSDGCFCISHSEHLNNKYLFYYLQTKTHYLQSQVRHAGIPTLDNPVVEKINVPLLSLPEQTRIVGILDTFTSSIENLKEQIAQRRKQYEYYRDQLLDLEGKEGVEMKRIGELFIFKNGLNKEKKFFGQGNPIVNYTDVYHNNRITKDILKGRVELSDSEIDRFRVCKGDVFFTRTSETKDEIGFAAVMLEDVSNCTFSGFLLRARPTTTLLLPEYCAYCFGSYNVRQEIIKSSTLTTRALTNGGLLSKISIPVPSLSEQQRIVSILDKFEASIQNLEAQLSQREKQYEYYRNKLLSFE